MYWVCSVLSRYSFFSMAASTWQHWTNTTDTRELYAHRENLMKYKSGSVALHHNSDTQKTHDVAWQTQEGKQLCYCTPCHLHPVDWHYTSSKTPHPPPICVDSSYRLYSPMLISWCTPFIYYVCVIRFLFFCMMWVPNIRCSHAVRGVAVYSEKGRLQSVNKTSL